jgi:hypothetical protein
MKEVTNIHILGCPKICKFERIADIEGSNSVIIQDSHEFEIIKSVDQCRMNKAISYLKWKRGKYRLNACQGGNLCNRVQKKELPVVSRQDPLVQIGADVRGKRHSGKFL